MYSVAGFQIRSVRNIEFGKIRQFFFLRVIDLNN
jgi:hypothetical protein